MPLKFIHYANSLSKVFKHVKVFSLWVGVGVLLTSEYVCNGGFTMTNSIIASSRNSLKITIFAILGSLCFPMLA